MKKPIFVLHCGECNHSLLRDNDKAYCRNSHCPQHQISYLTSAAYGVGGPLATAAVAEIDSA